MHEDEEVALCTYNANNLLSLSKLGKKEVTPIFLLVTTSSTMYA